MRVPLGWLADFVAVSSPPEELARKLTFAGLEVEAIRFVGLEPPAGERRELKVEGFAWDLEKVVVGDLVAVRPHPDADRLVLAEVDAGQGVQTTVTGAPNLLALRDAGSLETPLKVALAREGARLADPKGGGLRTLKRAKLRGVESAAMVCSERELGISDEHEGVILLDPDAPPAGTPLAELLGDVVLDVAITPNMVRNASILGVAREVAALAGERPAELPEEVEAGGPPVEERIAIEIRDPELNPRFTATLLEGATIGPSPYWLQHRLRLAGMRPINNIVDVTNYVMLETGQPLHAFDYDALVERAAASGAERPTIITRRPEPGERLETLDGVDRRLDGFTVLVTDTAGVLSLGGILGGAETEVRDTTTRVLLEAAAWSFLNIRRTTLAQQVSTEAGYRFSRGIHPAEAPRANRRAIELMRRLAGGTIARGMIDVYPRPAAEVVVELPLAEVERALGVAIPGDEVRRILEALEFGVEPAGDGLRLTVPDHRLDVGEGAVGIADVVEEIARIWGYERIPETQIEDAMPAQGAQPGLEREAAVRDLLVGLGLQEVVTYRLTTPEREARASRPGAAPEPARVELQNPISAERRTLRTALLPGVLEVAEANARQRASLALFELGRVFLPRPGELLPAEPRRLALAVCGHRAPVSWDRPEPPVFDFFDLKGIVEALLEGLRIEDAAFAPADRGGWRAGRAAALTIAGRPVGELGEIDPEVRAAYGLPAALFAAELDLEALIEAVPERFEVTAVAVFPPVVEDLAFVVDEGLPAARLEALVAAAGGELLRRVELFDVYRGAGVDDGKKSLAYRLTYQSAERTLTDDDVAGLRAAIVERAAAELGAALRA